MSENATRQNPAESPKAILEHLLRLMTFEDAKVESFDSEEGEVLLHVETAEAGRLIGRNAQVLESLQTVVNRMSRSSEVQPHCIVDVERYRERRKDKLLEMAIEAADRVERSGRSTTLPVMGSRDRRTIHRALADRAGVRTESEEVEPGEKRVVVYPADGDGARNEEDSPSAE